MTHSMKFRGMILLLAILATILLSTMAAPFQPKFSPISSVLCSKGKMVTIRYAVEFQSSEHFNTPFSFHFGTNSSHHLSPLSHEPIHQPGVLFSIEPQWNVRSQVYTDVMKYATAVHHVIPIAKNTTSPSSSHLLSETIHLHRGFNEIVKTPSSVYITNVRFLTITIPLFELGIATFPVNYDLFFNFHLNPTQFSSETTTTTTEFKLSGVASQELSLQADLQKAEKDMVEYYDDDESLSIQHSNGYFTTLYPNEQIDVNTMTTSTPLPTKPMRFKQPTNRSKLTDEKKIYSEEEQEEVYDNDLTTTTTTADVNDITLSSYINDLPSEYKASTYRTRFTGNSYDVDFSLSRFPLSNRASVQIIPGYFSSFSPQVDTADCWAIETFTECKDVPDPYDSDHTRTECKKTTRKDWSWNTTMIQATQHNITLKLIRDPIGDRTTSRQKDFRCSIHYVTPDPLLIDWRQDTQHVMNFSTEMITPFDKSKPTPDTTTPFGKAYGEVVHLDWSYWRSASTLLPSKRTYLVRELHWNDELLALEGFTELEDSFVTRSEHNKKALIIGLSVLGAVLFIFFALLACSCAHRCGWRSESTGWWSIFVFANWGRRRNYTTYHDSESTSSLVVNNGGGYVAPNVTVSVSTHTPSYSPSPAPYSTQGPVTPSPYGYQPQQPGYQQGSPYGH